MTKRQKFFSALGRFVKNIFTKNILLKVVALLFALLLWGYVLAIENPEYTKRVRDVEIGIVGESILNGHDLMLLTRDLGTTDVDVRCGINKHSDLDKTKVNCTVDLSNNSITLDEDENSRVFKLEVKASVPTEYGTVQGQTVSSVEVEIARMSSRENIQVSPKFTGSLPEGFTVEVLNNLSISLTGEKAALDRVVRGEVTVDLDEFPTQDPETLAKIYDKVLTVQFYDSANKRMDEIMASNGRPFSINVRVQIRAYKEVEIEPVIEMLDDGYTWDYVLSFSKIILYGDRATLDKIDTIKTETISATPYMTNTSTMTTLIIPEDVEPAQGVSKEVKVTLSVKEKTDTQAFDVVVDYALNENSFLTTEGPQTVRIKVTGPLSALSSFNPDWVKAKVDLKNYLEGKIDAVVRYEVDKQAGNELTFEFPTETISLELVRATEAEE